MGYTGMKYYWMTDDEKAHAREVCRWLAKVRREAALKWADKFIRVLEPGTLRDAIFTAICAAIAAEEKSDA